MADYYEENYKDDMTVEEVVEYIEKGLGHKLPKGVCVCEREGGGHSIICTSELTQEQREELWDELEKKDISSGHGTNETLRGTCTGNYVKR
jgi:hypothetical protein